MVTTGSAQHSTACQLTWVESCQHSCHGSLGPGKVGGACSQHTCTTTVWAHSVDTILVTPGVSCLVNRLVNCSRSAGELWGHDRGAAVRLLHGVAPVVAHLACTWVAGSHVGQCTAAATSSPAPAPVWAANNWASQAFISKSKGHVSATVSCVQHQAASS